MDSCLSVPVVIKGMEMALTRKTVEHWNCSLPDGCRFTSCVTEYHYTPRSPLQHMRCMANTKQCSALVILLQVRYSSYHFIMYTEENVQGSCRQMSLPLERLVLFCSVVIGSPSWTKWTHVVAGGMNQSITTPTQHNLSRTSDPGASMYSVDF